MLQRYVFQLLNTLKPLNESIKVEIIYIITYYNIE